MTDTTETAPLQVGDRVTVPGGPEIYTIENIVRAEGYEDAAQFKEGGFWRLSGLEKADG